MQLGKYRLIRRLGKGGMGEVWEGALDGEHGFSRRVAIKRMSIEGDGLSDRFLDEARIAARLHHANIVPVLDFGVEGDTWFQVLELIDGIDADALVQKAFDLGIEIPPELALHICAEVAHALASAHAARDEAGRLLGIVHRDVSLDNVLLSWEGDVKLSDFGVALARGRSHQTMAGKTVGKASYMAPEQATGADVDARSDVFALGCTLHALLTRVTPLAGESTLMELLAGKPLPLHDTLPADVKEIIERAVRRNRAERWSTAAEMAQALAKARHARLDKDPRAALAAFLAPIKRRGSKPAAGALDALLAPEESPVATTAPSQPRQKATRRRALPLAGIAVAVVAAALAVGTYGWLNQPVAVPAPPPAVVVTKAEPAPLPPPAPPPPPVEEKPAPVVVVPVRKAPASAPVGRGVIAIGGVAAQRAEILVDGRSQGFAPKRFEVAAGPHELVLVKPGGERIGPHRVDVTLANTELDPLKWIVE